MGFNSAFKGLMIQISKTLGCCSEFMQLVAQEDSTLYK
jgi:hypothetical protein